MYLLTHNTTGSVLVFVGGVLCAGGGIGGGGIYIPIYILLLGFTAHEAIPLSKGEHVQVFLLLWSLMLLLLLLLLFNY